MAWGQNNPKNPIVPLHIRKNHHHHRRAKTAATTISAPGSATTTTVPPSLSYSSYSKTPPQNNLRRPSYTSATATNATSTSWDGTWIQPSWERTRQQQQHQHQHRPTPPPPPPPLHHQHYNQSQQHQQNPKHHDQRQRQQLKQSNDITSGGLNPYHNTTNDRFSDAGIGIPYSNSTTKPEVPSGRSSRIRRSPTSRTHRPCPSMHMATRVPMSKGYTMYTMDGKNALIPIHTEWQRIQRISQSIRNGSLKGYTGNTIKDILVVGKGVAVKTLQFLYHALSYDPKAILATQYNMPLISSTGTDFFGASSTATISAAAAAAAVSTAANRFRMNFSPGSTASTATNASSPFLGSSTGTGASSVMGVGAKRKHRRRRIKFITTIDPTSAMNSVSDLDPSSTLLISVALSGSEETVATTKVLKSWLVQSLSGGTAAAPTVTSSINGQQSSTASSSLSVTELILSKHMILITGNDRIASLTNKPESVYVIPDHSRCDAFCNFSPVTLLPLAITFGWDIVQDYLSGGHDLDQHFVTKSPRHNLPVLLALMDVWNALLVSEPRQQQEIDNFSSIRAIKPFTESLEPFPAFVGALEAQVCSGNSISDQNATTSSSDDQSIGVTTPDGDQCNFAVSSVVIDGGVDGSFDRAFFQGSFNKHTINTELIMSLDNQVPLQPTSLPSGNQNTPYLAKTSGSQDSSFQPRYTNQRLDDHIQSTQDTLICSFFAHADELAFGNHKQQPPIPQQSSFHLGKSGMSTSSSISSGQLLSGGNTLNLSEGNRPSILLLTTKLDAFACGQLVALCEHRAAIKAHIWGIDPFAARQHVGSAPRMERTDYLQNELVKLILGDGTIEENNDDKSRKNSNLADIKPTISRSYDEDDDDDDDDRPVMMLSTKTILGHYASMVKEKSRPM